LRSISIAYPDIAEEEYQSGPPEKGWPDSLLPEKPPPQLFVQKEPVALVAEVPDGVQADGKEQIPGPDKGVVEHQAHQEENHEKWQEIFPGVNENPEMLLESADPNPPIDAPKSHWDLDMYWKQVGAEDDTRDECGPCGPNAAPNDFAVIPGISIALAERILDALSAPPSK
jgi:hypothetical protein